MKLFLSKSTWISWFSGNIVFAVGYSFASCGDYWLPSLRHVSHRWCIPRGWQVLPHPFRRTLAQAWCELPQRCRELSLHTFQAIGAKGFSKQLADVPTLLPDDFLDLCSHVFREADGEYTGCARSGKIHDFHNDIIIRRC